MVPDLSSRKPGSSFIDEALHFDLISSISNYCFLLLINENISEISPSVIMALSEEDTFVENDNGLAEKER